MPDIIKQRWLLLLVLIAFIAAKVPVLHYPFYWDESWSYAPAIKLMYQHGPSLMPDAIDTFFSRGHPLLFYASAATWMKVFGESHVAQHSFSLFITVLLIIAVYEVCLRLYNTRMATIALLATVAQVMIFVQSTLLLPEIMVALLALTAIYFYASGKHLLTFFSCTALVLTKESGATLGLVLGGHALYNLFNKKQAIRERLLNLAPVAGAGLILVLFFTIQYMLNHWVLYPEHKSYIDVRWPTIMGKYRFVLEILFTHQSRTYIFVFACVMSIVAAIASKNMRYLYILPLAVVLIIIETNTLGYISRKALIPFSFLALIYSLYTLTKLNKHTGKQGSFILLSAAFFVVYISFCCINFFTDRYLATALIFLIIITSYALDCYLKTMPAPAIYSSMATIALSGYLGFTTGPKTGDVNLGIYDAMKVQQDVAGYMEQNNLYNEYITAPSSLERVHLLQPNTGFLRSGRSFKHVDFTIGDSTRYLIIDNIEQTDSAAPLIPASNFSRVYHTQHGGSWADIYRNSK